MMQISRLITPLGVLLLCAGCASTTPQAGKSYDVQIRRTEFGIPHIQAAGYGSLGYGLGYAYAQDNVCLVADQVLTVRGERSRFFGPDGKTVVAFRQVSNLDSDFFFTATMDDAALRRAYGAGSAHARALTRGYVDGYNRYLRDTPRATLPSACRNAAWVRPIDETDLYRLLEEKATQAGTGAFLVAVLGAQPPAAATASQQAPVDLAALSEALQAGTATPAGPVVAMPEAGLTWSTTRAYVLADANRHNARMLDTWLNMNRAHTVAQVEQAIGNLGIPWVNTVAADRHGDVMYADISAVPNVSTEQMNRCSREPGFQQIFAKTRILVLDGTSSACGWKRDAASPVPGLLTRQDLPAMTRQDYVANSNDSYWLANPKHRLKSLAPLLGPTAVEQGLRTRMGLAEIGRLLACPQGAPGKCAVTARDVQDILFRNDNFAARLVLDDFLQLLADSADPALRPAAQVLAAWDRSNRADSRGAHLFHEWWTRLRGTPALYRIGFDPADPVNTPRGLNTENPKVREATVTALKGAVAAIRGAGHGLDTPLGALQRVTRGGVDMPVHGGADREGVLNQIDVTTLSASGYTPKSGSSYIQTVSFNDDGPDAQGLLIYGQSADPDSPLYFDQMSLFAQNKLSPLPFSDRAIREKATTMLHLQE